MGTIELHNRPVGPAHALDLTAKEIATAVARLVVRALKRAGHDLYDWQELARQRHNFATLDERMLKDMGLDRASFGEWLEQRQRRIVPWT